MGEVRAIEWDEEEHENQNPHDLVACSTAGILWDFPEDVILR
jgi:hypothetical protein